MTDIPEWQLSRISALIAERMGLHFPKARWSNLERGIIAAVRELEFENGQSFIEWLLSSSPTKRQIEVLVCHLTVGETYFFRDKSLFQTLEEPILSDLIRLRRKSGKYLRLWSAGCSSGEEPYSLAILLSKMIPDIGEWNVTILATDINTRALRKGADGVYGQWSFRDIQPGIKEVFFNSKGDKRFEIHSRIRKMVTFSYLNLVEDTYPSLMSNTNALDIIFCRNVLMYLIPEVAGNVVRKLHRSLVDGGFLVVSPTESSSHISSLFKTIRVPGTILYKKGSPEGTDKSHHGLLTKPASKSRPVFNPVPAARPVIPSTPVQIIPQPEVSPPPPASRAAESDNPDRNDIFEEAETLYQGGSYHKAAERAEKLLSQNPSDAACLALLARIYANWGKLDKALESCGKAIVEEKLHAGYHYLMATILQELGRIEDAIVSFKRTLYLDTRFTLAYVALGNISRKSGKRKEAAKHFENALALLNTRNPEEVLPEAEGINAERLIEIIKTMQQS
jgi:chemotaxis protein methyltransferase CheR